MKALTTIATLFLLSSVVTTTLAQDNTLSTQEKAEGWSLLFDGKTMSHWRNFKQQGLNDGWVIDSGAMKLTKAGAGDIITKDKYTDFEFTIDWKVSEGGNSGILLLADEQGDHVYSHAPEVQILDNEKAHDNKIDTHLAGSLYDMVAVHKSAQKPAGEWNTTRVHLKDGLLQVWQNDVMTTNLVMGSSTWNKLVAASKFATWDGFGANESGHFGLQDHGNVVWFKNIKVRELK